MRIKITVEKIPEDGMDSSDDKMVYETCAEKGIDEWNEFFIVFLTFLGFALETIKEMGYEDNL